MLAAERRQYILELLRKEGRVLATELSTRLGTSEDTIRRDLRDMDAEGLIQRVHGGALLRSPDETSYSHRQKHISQAKIGIAQRAAEMIKPGMVVFLTGGTTNVQLAASLPLDLNATIITHNPAVAVALADHQRIEVILIGGKLFKRSMVTVGGEALQAIRGMHADLCMLGVCSLHHEKGITIPDMEESVVTRAMIEQSADVAALATVEKLGTASHFTVGPIQDLQMIITERSAPTETLQPYRDLGIEIVQ